jgi:carbonic anhydrase
MDRLLEGYGRFRAERWPAQKALYERLAEGQTPRLLVIACSDSRVDPAQIFDVAPGELFIVRNVAALVPPCEQGEGLHGTSAAIEFAVETLGVKTILVMGHARCGGVKAAIDRGRYGSKGALAQSQKSFVSQWIDLLDPVVASMGDGPEREDNAERAAVVLSLDHLLTFPFVAAKVEAGTLNLEGARFDIASGRLDLYNHARKWVRADQIVDAVEDYFSSSN